MDNPVCSVPILGDKSITGAKRVAEKNTVQPISFDWKQVITIILGFIFTVIIAAWAYTSDTKASQAVQDWRLSALEKNQEKQTEALERVTDLLIRIQSEKKGK
jgi:hypothetical protein